MCDEENDTDKRRRIEGERMEKRERRVLLSHGERGRKKDERQRSATVRRNLLARPSRGLADVK